MLSSDPRPHGPHHILHKAHGHYAQSPEQREQNDQRYAPGLEPLLFRVEYYTKASINGCPPADDFRQSAEQSLLP
ncbi:hypothetical protein LZ554_008954 [Drepanopeziza brunnea f. sp. 'monogermtubi']|nr:hypothetical protein LZ554_008954 [Drepanopeziza brunnea f. sp. 'monogermtubi']